MPPIHTVDGVQPQTQSWGSQPLSICWGRAGCIPPLWMGCEQSAVHALPSSYSHVPSPLPDS